MTQFFAVYGKGGIGKSTIVAHLSIAFARRSLKVLQVGCDPKRDSTYAITGVMFPTITEALSAHDFHYEAMTFAEIVHQGYGGVSCIEIGGPPSGVGCGGYVIGEALQYLGRLDFFELFDIVLFDVLGDVVCGGFSVPLQYAKRVCIVATEDFDSVFAANRIAAAVQEKAKTYPVRLAGIIGNKCATTALLQRFCQEINTPLITAIPHRHEIIHARLHGMTLFQWQEQHGQDIPPGYVQPYEIVAEHLLANVPPSEEYAPTPLPELEVFRRYMHKENETAA